MTNFIRFLILHLNCFEIEVLEIVFFVCTFFCLFYNLILRIILPFLFEKLIKINIKNYFLRIKFLACSYISKILGCITIYSLISALIFIFLFLYASLIIVGTQWPYTVFKI